ncbi:MAG: flagellar protein FliS [Lachnospiraceae bacterium]|nr:flagellar protein FliS [Lachnospiraceae bacterium]
MNKDMIREFTMRVSSANKTEMVVILYDIAITYIGDAKKALAKGDKPTFRLEVGHIRNTVKELMDSVNTSTDIGLNLMRLYVFCNGELTRAFLDYSEEPLNHVYNTLSKLREGYAEVSRQDTSGPVMVNTERVYSGLTYNKKRLNEYMSSSEGNRGILA